MGNAAVASNRNDSANNNNEKTVYDTATTVTLLKALFESGNYCFSSFSTNDHGKIVQKAIESSQQQDNTKPVQLNGDSVLNEFVNYLYTIFSNFASTNDINKNTNDGMVKYEIYSVQSLNLTTLDNQCKSIWLPKSMIIEEAHRIVSTVLYSSKNDTIPVDLADYVLVYENVIISLENQSKEFYEEILKISFRLNRVILFPIRLLIIHKSYLLLLERKESQPLLIENESISILQLIMFHLIKNNTNQSENDNMIVCSKGQNHEYWPIMEVKMGIIPSSHLIHPLKHNKLSQLILKIMRTNNLSIESTTTSLKHCLTILEMIFLSVNADISYIKLILPSLSKLIQIYDYPLLVALPYDRLLLSQFSKTQCSDGRYAKGIMANGKYYSLYKNLYTSMPELKINPGSIIHLRFTFQSDTIINGNVSSSQNNQTTINDRCEEMSSTNTDKFTSTKYRCSAEFDNKTVYLMFPSEAIVSMTSTISKSDTISSCLKSSNNWVDLTKKMNESRKQMDKLSLQKADLTVTSQSRPSNQISTNDNSLNQVAQTMSSSATSISKPSTSSLTTIDKPECLNCLSYLNDDNLECPHCTQLFCRICIESSCDSTNRDHYCPKCCNKVQLSAYRKSTIIGKFEKEGISALQCTICRLMSKQPKLCPDLNCSALICYNCCKDAIKSQSSSTTEEINSTEMIKCPICKKSDMYISNAVLYYSGRIIEYQMAQQIESKSSVSSGSKSLPKSAWKQEDWLPEKGTLEENHNRIISVIQFNGAHIQFGNKEEYCPLLIINEPAEYTCPESLRLSYWNTNNEINRWEDELTVRFHKYNNGSIGAYIPHFTDFTARNIRFTEHIMLNTAYLDTLYDYDFTRIIDGGTTFQRGPEPYTRPCGWYRKAIRVLGVYDNAAWLGTGTDAWPVAYHGTATANALSILRAGLLAGGSTCLRADGSNDITIPVSNGNCYGPGIYLSPDPLHSDYYAPALLVDNRQYKIIFQVRVKSDSIIKHSGSIWKCANTQDVRPYGILFKEIERQI